MDNLIVFAPVAGVLALLFATVLAGRVSRSEAGTPRMKEIAEAIHEGSMAFLGREYRTLVIFVIILTAIILASAFLAPAGG